MCSLSIHIPDPVLTTIRMNQEEAQAFANQMIALALYDAILLNASQLGHTEAMVQLGFVVEGEHDYSRACEFFKQAADLGNGEGAFSYADRLMNGKGVPKDESLAIMYYKLAMKSDSPATGKAATIVGAYMSRIGKTDEAIAAYQRALDKGFEPIHTRMCLNKLMKKKD